MQAGKKGQSRLHCILSRFNLIRAAIDLPACLHG
jgi:hypothetical protein